MIRKFKSLGLVLIAVLVISAFLATAAQGAPVFTTSAGTVGVHGTGEGIGEKFTIDGVATECKTSHFAGTVTNGSSTVVLNPSYTGCTLAGTGLTMHVKTNGCAFHYTLTEVAGTTYRAHTKITCPTAAPIQVEGTGTSCEYTLGPAANENLTTVDLTKDATDLTIKPTISGITATVTKDGFLCPYSGTGVKTGGTYTSTGYITLTPSSGSVQISGV
jgi:hypothetical protein